MKQSLVNSIQVQEQCLIKQKASWFVINQKEQEANTNHKKATIFNLVLGKEALTPCFKESN